MEDIFLRADSFAAEPWYNEFRIFLSIGVSESEFDRLRGLWDAREQYIDENGKFSDRVSEILQSALNGCGEKYWDDLDDFDKMKQRREDDIKRIEKENAENDYKRRHNNNGGFTQ